MGVRRRPRRAAEDRGARDALGKPCRPFVGLLAAHRPADDEGEPLDPEHLGHESSLEDDVVVDRCRREAAAGERGGALLGEVETPLPSMFGTTTHQRAGSSARSGPMR